MESGTTNEIIIPPLERKKRRRVTPAAVMSILVFFLLCAWLGYWLAQSFLDPLVPREPEAPGTFTSNEILNILLLGVDQREDEPARADTIILASLNLAKKEVNLLSIPRDTRVEIPGKGVTRKVNYSHAVGGPDLTVATVEKFLNLPVHYYIETNFDGFSKAIDILGGISLNVEQRMYLPDEKIDLKAGLQKLNGHNALSYVRWRGDGKGDIGRIERQQKFFKAVLDQALSFSTVWKIPDLITELNKNVKTDMGLQKMIVLGNKFKDISSITLKSQMVPGVPDDINYGGSYWIADKKELARIVEDIYQKPAAATVTASHSK